MKILAIDSSGLVASVAIVEDDNLLGEYTMNYKKTHSQTLLPMLDEVARMMELDMKTIDAIAVSAGPGSFTGLRIGSATAKGLALALGKEIVSVPTVDAMAYNLWGCDKQICPLMDARRQQAYTGRYTFDEGQFITIEPQNVLSIEEIINQINESGRETVSLIQSCKVTVCPGERVTYPTCQFAGLSLDHPLESITSSRSGCDQLFQGGSG